MARNIKLRIWRGDSTDGGLKDVVVEANEGEVVLDVIHRVQATQMAILLFAGTVRLVSVVHVQWKSMESPVLHA